MFGSAIHRSVEHHFNELMAGNAPPPLEALVGEYDRHGQKTDEGVVKFGKEEDRDSLDALAWRMLAAFQTSTLTKAKAPSVELHEVPADPQKIERIKAIVERVWRAIDAEHFYPSPSTMSCGGCPFREPCRAWCG